MNTFEKGIEHHIGSAALTKIQAVRVGIAGAGGLGSNCAQNLVRSGFRKFILVDFDQVEPSNLNRQFFFSHQVGKPKVEMLAANLTAINPDLELNLLRLKLDATNIQPVFEDCAVIVEAFDTRESKKMIIETYMNSDKLLVAASGLAGWGDNDTIRVHQIRPNFFLVGDLLSETGPDMPPTSPRVNIAAAKQADLVLTYILGQNIVTEYL
jgi:sulfur carrier protein ThiS adenylyltransferase